MLEKWIKNRMAAEISEIIILIVCAWLAYQAMGLALGTSMPMISVVSKSMEPNLHIGDLIIVSSADYQIGDIIVFNVPAGKQGPIIHRIIAKNSDGTFQTKGDNNAGQLAYEKSISRQNIIGRARWAIPLLGYPRLLLFAFGV
jgi:signal peptidase I